MCYQQGASHSSIRGAAPPDRSPAGGADIRRLQLNIGVYQAMKITHALRGTGLLLP
jgi:hypothetical protein